ncbi:MAG: hypothetical protein HOP08_07700 [Cyclobacteriaceae bacterium]|nr:hypothetical protein [Cyclobacteriaceae bacterium]
MAIKSFFRRHWVALSLFSIVLIATGIRLYHLDYQSLWIDEIASMNGADPDLSVSAVIRYSVADQPPAFFLLLHGWFKLVPFTDFNGRLLALIVGLAGIVAIYFLGKEVRDSRVGLAAAAITTFSYIHIFFSQDVRFYTLVFLFCTLSYLFLIRAVKNSRLIDFIFYIIFTSGVLYSHYFGVIVFATQGILFCLLLVFYSFNKKFIICSISSAFIIIAIISPWIPILFSDAKGGAFWLEPEPFYFLIKYFYVYFKDVVASFVFASLLIFYFLHIYKTYRTDRRIEPVDFILIGSVSLSFLMPIIYSIIKTPLLNVRYTIIALPCLIIMICLGLMVIKPSFQKAVIIITCSTSLLSLIFIEKYYTVKQKEDWRGMIQQVIKKGYSDDVFISQYAWYCNYYFKTLKSDFRSSVPEQFNADIEKPAGIWWMDGFSPASGISPGETKLLESGYVLKETDSLFRMKARYYRRSD